MQSYANKPAPLPPSQLAVFDSTRSTRIRDITDGTSHTMCIVEGLTGPDEYYRGFVWSDQPGGAFAYTQLGPNSRLPDILYPNGGQYKWCDNQPEANMPCVGGNTTNDHNCNHTAASRSRHPGGVQVLMADGSVQWIEEDIDTHPVGDPLFPGIWQTLAFIADGEVITEY